MFIKVTMHKICVCKAIPKLTFRPPCFILQKRKLYCLPLYPNLDGEAPRYKPTSIQGYHPQKSIKMGDQKMFQNGGEKKL